MLVQKRFNVIEENLIESGMMAVFNADEEEPREPYQLVVDELFFYIDTNKWEIMNEREQYREPFDLDGEELLGRHPFTLWFNRRPNIELIEGGGYCNL